MGLRDVASTLAQVPTLLALKRELKPRPYAEKDCFARQVEANAVRFGERTAIVFEGRSVTWAEFNALANRYANHLASQGVVRGDVVSLVMENRIEFLAVTVALNKLGATAGVHQHQPARPAPDPLHHGHRVQEVRLWRGTGACLGGGQERTAPRRRP